MTRDLRPLERFLHIPPKVRLHVRDVFDRYPYVGRIFVRRSGSGVEVTSFDWATGTEPWSRGKYVDMLFGALTDAIAPVGRPLARALTVSGRKSARFVARNSTQRRRAAERARSY